MQKFLLIILLPFLFVSSETRCQDLMDMLGSDSAASGFVTGTFKTTHLLIGQSVETVSKGELNFTISHHFGKINGGYKTFFGLDQSTIRLGVEYGINKRLAVGIGRSSFQQTVDGNLKFKILRQKENGMPLTATYFGGMTVNTSPWEDPNRVNYFTSRLAYVHQLLIASKITEEISLQLMPSFVHKNLVKLKTDQNDIYALGGGMRYRLFKRMSVNAEYYYLLPGKTADDNDNSLSLGVDIETGGHVFQLLFTNSHPLFERGFITETQGTWAKSEIFFGFNITRTFTIVNYD